MAKLKVFRTPIGFHDAYVAAPSQKAALAAWGTDANLFASGLAEQVTDPKLIDAPLRRPGEVIRVMRGSEQDHFRELAKGRTVPRRSAPKAKAARPAVAASRPERPPPITTAPREPRPSRRALDRAEAALALLETDYAARLEALAARELMLKQERAQLRADHEQRARALQMKREKVRADYHRRIEEWAAQ